MPEVSVTVAATPGIDGLRASTVTPGSTPWESSRITPWMEPVCSCAATGIAQIRATAAMIASLDGRLDLATGFPLLVWSRNGAWCGVETARCNGVTGGDVRNRRAGR